MLLLKNKIAVHIPPLQESPASAARKMLSARSRRYLMTSSCRVCSRMRSGRPAFSQVASLERQDALDVGGPVSLALVGVA